MAVNLFDGFDGLPDKGRRLRRFLDRHQPVFTTLKGTVKTAMLFEKTKRIPTVFVFDPQGKSRLQFVYAKKGKKPIPAWTNWAGPNALRIGSAGGTPSLPESAVSVTKRSYSPNLADIRS